MIILDSSGGFWDATAGFASPILSLVGATDFAMVSMFGRAYISPHDGNEGLQEVGIYVYDPSVSANARLAAGDPPSDFELITATTTPSTALTDVVAPVAPANGAMTLTTSPFVPVPPSTLKFTQAGGAVTNETFTVIGFDGAGEAATEVYTDVIKSAGPLTYTTLEVWSSITSITVTGLIGAGGTWKVEITGKPGGKIERGYHVIAIAYETASGFITRPGPATSESTNYAVHLVTQAKKVITVSAIPATPPTGTVKIHILASKSIVKNRYTGNPDEYELFFVPDTSGGIINVGTTSAVINFFDADLVDSADFLKDNLSQIPAGVTLLATSKGRLLVAGLNSDSVVGGNQDLANNTVIFGSKGGEPEAFSGTDGFVIVKPGGDGLRNLAEYRSLIYAYKGTRTYVTQDNGGLLSEWEIESIDDAIGTECHGVSVALGSDSASEDVLIVASRSGLQVFNGTYAERPLSWKIRELWNEVVNADSFNELDVAIDPVNKFIFIAVPFATPSYPATCMLYADYSDGLSWDTIKWCPWIIYNDSNPLTVSSIFTTFENSESVLRISSVEGDVFTYKYRSGVLNDNGTERDAFFETSKLNTSESGGVTQITGARLKITGPCTLTTQFFGPLGINSETPPAETIIANQITNVLIRTNLVEDDISFYGSTTDIDDQFQITKIWVFGNEAWVERPA